VCKEGGISYSLCAVPPSILFSFIIGVNMATTKKGCSDHIIRDLLAMNIVVSIGSAIFMGPLLSPATNRLFEKVGDQEMPYELSCAGIGLNVVIIALGAAAYYTFTKSQTEADQIDRENYRPANTSVV
jgi:hypothetical protein